MESVNPLGKKLETFQLSEVEMNPYVNIVLIADQIIMSCC